MSLNFEEMKDLFRKGVFDEMVQRALGPDAAEKISEIAETQTDLPTLQEGISSLQNNMDVSNLSQMPRDVMSNQSQRPMNVAFSDPERAVRVKKAIKSLNSESPLDRLAMMRMQQQPTMQAKAGTEGMTMSFGSGPVPGEGHGMQDNIQMPIVEKGNKVATLAVSPDEYIVDAHTMSALGNGSADAGADVMDKVVKEIRQKAFGTTKQPEQINGLASLRSAIG
tara:strand:- start:5393 stop:6061 length:669 start_codon:yes stop_codon:yes gene_type:complete